METNTDYSVFTTRQKKVSIMIVSFAAMISPLSGSMYYPATSTLAAHYGVSTSMIQLTITTYQIMQGLAPSLLANLSDTHGRRPAYALCLAVYLAANVGLALQDRYAALLALRCLQSAGSSATVALAAGSVADLATRAERGRFVAYAALGVTLGPALGPVLGGLLAAYAGWRAIFWFLAAFAAGLGALYAVAAPETARRVVGNGGVPPPPLLMTPAQAWRRRRRQCATGRGAAEAAAGGRKQRGRRVDPLAALRILAEREGGVTLGFGSLMYGGYFMVLTTLPLELGARFGFGAARVGLCYLPIFAGSILSRSTAGRLLDWNFRRHAKRLGIAIVSNRQPRMEGFPIEAARLQVCLPMIYATAVSVVVYGWVMQSNSSLAGIEVSLFFLGLCNSGGLSGLNTLVIDTHQDSPATALAANNLFRCLVSAGATALAVPLINRIGIGWTSVFIAGVWIAFSPLLWLVLLCGASWREAKRAKEEDASRENP
ncbi:MFS general substrate transporter [Xylariomycetidae sp. FL0641]|nr:MFS general substrate transporter [Xylariomycetidae sp. FL0641]